MNWSCRGRCRSSFPLFAYLQGFRCSSLRNLSGSMADVSRRLQGPPYSGHREAPQPRGSRGGGITRRRKSMNVTHAHASARRSFLPAIVSILALLLLLPAWAAAKQDGHSDNGKGKVVTTMTRNLYLGADLAPAIGAKTLNEFVTANGKILREVTANDFPTRAKGLAQEILS